MLKREYKKAVQQDKAVFMFQGAELLVSYAKYLIQFLESNKHLLG